jgi:hypothetical protein
MRILLLLVVFCCSFAPAGPAAFVFSTFLQKFPESSQTNNGWRVLLQRTADGRIAASWFMDAENLRCAVTSVATQEWYNAQPEAVSSTCKVYFKVTVKAEYATDSHLPRDAKCQMWCQYLHYVLTWCFRSPAMFLSCQAVLQLLLLLLLHDAGDLTPLTLLLPTAVAAAGCRRVSPRSQQQHYLP